MSLEAFKRKGATVMGIKWTACLRRGVKEGIEGHKPAMITAKDDFKHPSETKSLLGILTV